MKRKRHGDSTDLDNGRESAGDGGAKREYRESSTPIAKLLHSLNVVLDEQDGTSLQPHSEIARTAAHLRTLLQNEVEVKDSTKSQENRPAISPAVSPPAPPVTIKPVSITPWRASEIPKALPPLPTVLDRTLEVASFTQRGSGSGNFADLSYERLEWVGDAYIYLTSTLLIAQTFPALLPGRLSQLRERLVKNVTLAGYAHEYGFEKRAILPKGLHNSKDKELTKIYGDMFEAYVAAVVLSDPKDGVTRATEWLKMLWSQTLAAEIKREEQGPRHDNPMWRLRGDVAQVQTLAQNQMSPKDELRRAIGAKGVDLVYTDAGPPRADRESGLALFTVSVLLTGWGERGKALGHGTALSKKEAGEKAAEMALANKKLIGQYLEKKRLFQEQRLAEEAALAKQAGSAGT